MEVTLTILMAVIVILSTLFVVTLNPIWVEITAVIAVVSVILAVWSNYRPKKYFHRGYE